ncbi:cytochrome b5 isoform X2 [Neodiprion pinetum]|uniref:Cytochrome b5 isoform X1 n=1 Tax=Neodiprion lecontei TaxID=441921 RepID=A0ABM3GGX2_NEOLC|nr:cytochrome b5-like isoform X2 [Neodiprion pinetum]XP_046599498.1 cytochrome b5 isoform X1 [Neodiprion lecontei]
MINCYSLVELRHCFYFNDAAMLVSTSQHPGGRDSILEYAGQDATKAFNDVGHSGDARSYLKGAKIGELIEEDKLANRKKKNQSAESSTKTASHRSVLSIISCGLCG